MGQCLDCRQLGNNPSSCSSVRIGGESLGGQHYLSAITHCRRTSSSDHLIWNLSTGIPSSSASGNLTSPLRVISFDKLSLLPYSSWRYLKGRFSEPQFPRRKNDEMQIPCSRCSVRSLRQLGVGSNSDFRHRQMRQA